MPVDFFGGGSGNKGDLDGGSTVNEAQSGGEGPNTELRASFEN